MCQVYTDAYSYKSQETELLKSKVQKEILKMKVNLFSFPLSKINKILTFSSYISNC